MNIKVHPAPQPPQTYDLLGLTEEEAALVRDLIGCSPGDITYRLYRQLKGVVSTPFSARFVVTKV